MTTAHAIHTPSPTSASVANADSTALAAFMSRVSPEWRCSSFLSMSPPYGDGS